MDARASALVGDWDVYAGGMHTELHLDASANYVHTLWGVRKHWGTWSLQDQNGFTYLVLQLADALPRVAAGFLGLRQVPWPTYEAWPVLRNDADTVMLQNAWMHRRVESPPAVPAFVPPYPVAPLPMPSVPAPPPAPLMAFPPQIAFPPPPPPIAFPPPPPPLPVSSDPAQPLPTQSVLDQWKQEHSDWDKVREVIAKTIQADNDTTRQINDMYAAQGVSDFQSTQQNILAMNAGVHEGAKNFIEWLRTGRT
jgi:hypothetical protein